MAKRPLSREERDKLFREYHEELGLEFWEGRNVYCDLISNETYKTVMRLSIYPEEVENMKCPKCDKKFHWVKVLDEIQFLEASCCRKIYRLITTNYKLLVESESPRSNKNK